MSVNGVAKPTAINEAQQVEQSPSDQIVPPQPSGSYVVDERVVACKFAALIIQIASL